MSNSTQAYDNTQAAGLIGAPLGAQLAKPQSALQAALDANFMQLENLANTVGALGDRLLPVSQPDLKAEAKSETEPAYPASSSAVSQLHKQEAIVTAITRRIKEITEDLEV